MTTDNIETKFTFLYPSEKTLYKLGLNEGVVVGSDDYKACSNMIVMVYYKRESLLLNLFM